MRSSSLGKDILPSRNKLSLIGTIALAIILSPSSHAVQNAGLEPSCMTSTQLMIDTGAYNYSSFVFGDSAAKDGSGFIRRYYLCRLPTGYVATQTYPVVFVLHGGGMNMCTMRNGARLGPGQYTTGESEKLLGSESVIYVYPQGVLDASLDDNYMQAGFHFNDGRVAENNYNDVGYIHAILSRLIWVHGLKVNSQRVYSMGVSNGGIMSLRLAKESNKFAAVASISGGMPRTFTVTPPTKPTPSLVALGTLDPSWNGTTQIYSAAETNDLQRYWLGAETANLAFVNVSSIYRDTSGGIQNILKYYMPTKVNGKSAELWQLDDGGHCIHNGADIPQQGVVCGTNVAPPIRALSFFAGQPDLTP